MVFAVSGLRISIAGAGTLPRHAGCWPRGVPVASSCLAMVSGVLGSMSSDPSRSFAQRAAAHEMAPFPFGYRLYDTASSQCHQRLAKARRSTGSLSACRLCYASRTSAHNIIIILASAGFHQFGICEAQTGPNTSAKLIIKLCPLHLHCAQASTSNSQTAGHSKGSSASEDVVVFRAGQTQQACADGQRTSRPCQCEMQHTCTQQSLHPGSGGIREEEEEASREQPFWNMFLSQTRMLAYHCLPTYYPTYTCVHVRGGLHSSSSCS